MLLRKDDNLSTELKKALRDVEDMKSVQVAGGISFVNYLTSSDDTYDVSVLMNSKYKDFRIGFQHEEPYKFHIINPSVFYRVNNSAVMASPEVVDFATGRSVRIIREKPTVSQNSWIMSAVDLAYGSHGGDYTYFIKLFFRGTTKGTFFINAL